MDGRLERPYLQFDRYESSETGDERRRADCPIAPISDDYHIRVEKVGVLVEYLDETLRPGFLLSLQKQLYTNG
jgi:hypothetical protein